MNDITLDDRNCWLITGEPVIGKTTVLTKTIKSLRFKGFSLGGVICQEIKNKRERIGFELFDVSSGEKGILASKNLNTGPKFGRYRINLKDLAEIGAKALMHALNFSDLIICDEIGPMELYSPDFRRAVDAIIRSQKPVLGIIHKYLKDPFVLTIKSNPRVEIIEVTLENREGLPEILTEKIASKL